MIEILMARLLTGHSATAVLEAWCSERALPDAPRLCARPMSVSEKPLSPEQRARLAIAADEPVRYRRVRLTCGAHVLSEAENWYVPARLSPEMNATLEGTRAPFGRVVHPLAPRRHNLALRMIWRPGETPSPGASDALFSIDAYLCREDGLPFCEVAEIYTGAVLAGG